MTVTLGEIMRASVSLVPLVLVLGSLATPARADAPNLVLSVTPWAAHDGVERPWRYIVSARLAAGVSSAEVVADRRLLTFEVTPSTGRRRRLSCRHPAAPRSTSTGRVRTLSAGETWTEWVDLRMYCWGRSLSALREGADIEVRYGWRRATPRRWVARDPAGGRRSRLGSATAELLFPGVSAGDATTRILADPTEIEPDQMASNHVAPITVSLAAASARTGTGLYWRVSIGSRGSTARVYARADHWSFTVDGPLGSVVCSMAPGGGTPPPDLFSRVSRRVRFRDRLEAVIFCPRHTFDIAGVYEVTPSIHLPHSGQEWELDAVVGRFAGPMAPVRIVSGRRSYAEQVPERANRAEVQP